VIFIKEPEIELITEEQQRNRQTIKEFFSCYHVQEYSLEEDDPHDIHIEEAKSEREVESPPIESKIITALIKINKFNIGTVENPKMASIKDY
jgi:hypothetical protein